MLIERLKCTGCGAGYPAGDLMNLCPVDGRPVEILLDLQRLLEEGLIRPREKVVVFNTGSLEEYLPELRHLLR